MKQIVTYFLEIELNVYGIKVLCTQKYSGNIFRTVIQNVLGTPNSNEKVLNYQKYFL
jgi:hypothetical protein